MPGVHGPIPDRALSHVMISHRDIKVGHSQAYLTVGHETIKATFSRKPYLDDHVKLKKNFIRSNTVEVADHGQSVIITVKKLAQALHMKTSTLTGLFDGTKALDITSLEEIALFVDMEQVDQRCFDQLSSWSPSNAKVRLCCLQRLLKAKKQGL
jgi:hypothetical protein